MHKTTGELEMRKQVNFDIIVETLATTSGGDGKAKYEVFDRIEKQCPKEDGWELLQTEVAQVAANSISILFVMVQYKNVPEPDSPKETRTHAK